MSSTKILLLILGMAVVTYLPRALPIFLSGKLHFHGKVEKFLKLMPYTAMSALIFPGVFTVDGANSVIGIAGGAVAGLLACLRCPVMVCVLAAIAVDFVLYLVL